MAGAARADAPVLYGVAEPGEPIGKLRRARSPARPRRARRRRRRRQPQSLTAMRVSSLSALAAALVALLPAPALALETSFHTYDGFNERSEEHTSELQSLMRISYAVFCLQKQTKKLLYLTTDISPTTC